MAHDSPGSDFATQTVKDVEGMRQTCPELAALLARPPHHVTSVGPAADAWSATEVVCHLRDIEEAYCDRMRLILANDSAQLIQFDPERWVTERQYARADAMEALAAFRARREDTLAFLAALAPDQWDRSADHPSRGRLSIRKIVHSLAKHDAEHLDQIARALAGKP